MLFSKLVSLVNANVCCLHQIKERITVITVYVKTKTPPLTNKAVFRQGHVDPPCPTPRRWLLPDLFMPLPPSSTPWRQLVCQWASRQVWQSSSAGASSLCGRGKATEQQEMLCVISELPEGCQSGPLLRLPYCLPPFIFYSSVVVLVKATGFRLDSGRYVLLQRGPLMLC